MLLLISGISELIYVGVVACAAKYFFSLVNLFCRKKQVTCVYLALIITVNRKLVIPTEHHFHQNINCYLHLLIKLKAAYLYTPSLIVCYNSGLIF